jgi:hypothetical protein
MWPAIEDQPRNMESKKNYSTDGEGEGTDGTALGEEDGL